MLSSKKNVDKQIDEADINGIGIIGAYYIFIVCIVIFIKLLLSENSYELFGMQIGAMSVFFFLKI